MDSLRILIVEDQDSKFQDVEQKVLRRFKREAVAPPVITRAISYTSAVICLKESYFEIIVLDLKLPLTDHGMPEFAGSVYFLDYLKGAPQSRPFRILGLTSYLAKHYPAKLRQDETFVIHRYSSTEDSWLDGIMTELQFVLTAKSALMRYYSESVDLDVLLIVARFENEYEPIRATIDWVSSPVADLRIKDRQSAFGRIRIAPGKIVRAGLVCVEETGLSTAAAMIGYLVSLHRPRHVFMLGMCCGLNDDTSPTKALLGDVIIAGETACWDEGKYSEELVKDDPFYVRAVTRTPDPGLRTACRSFLETKSKVLQQAMLEASDKFDLNAIASECKEPITTKPRAYSGMMLSGSSVVDSVRQIETIRKRFPNAIALEMEAHAVYSAIDVTVGVKPLGLVVKGVADHGQGKKNSAAQPWASSLSYVVAREFLASAWKR